MNRFTIHVGRLESLRRLTSADLNRCVDTRLPRRISVDSRRPTRIAVSVHGGRLEEETKGHRNQTKHNQEAKQNTIGGAALIVNQGPDLFPIVLIGRVPANVGILAVGAMAGDARQEA